jgi:hypothetical protein
VIGESAWQIGYERKLSAQILNDGRLAAFVGGEMFKWLLVGIIALGLLLFLIAFRARLKPPANDFDKEMTWLAKAAVSRAKQEFATELDFTSDSVEKVEAILAKLHTMHQAKAFTEEEMADEAALWAAYIGAIIKQKKPGHWECDSQVAGKNTFPLIHDDGDEVYLLFRVRNRIVNGDIDNVWMAYQSLYHSERFKRVNLEDFLSEASEK